MILADPSSQDPAGLDRLLTEIRACRICRDAPASRAPLPHEPRPIVQAAESARIAIAGQAPGTRVHASGRPFTDPSGERLRAWMGLAPAAFYDAALVAILPMGFCFPGLDAKGSDLPPRPECAPAWRTRLLAELPAIELLVLVGSYAQRWHLGAEAAAGGMTETVRRWRDLAIRPGGPHVFPVPHPSWRNSGWLKRNPWFEAELLPDLRGAVAERVNGSAGAVRDSSLVDQT